MMCNHRVQVWDKSITSGRAWTLVPCGRCIACRLNKGRAWSVRIMNEVKHAPASCFVTLTYDDDHLPASKSLSVEDCQKFMKRLRKNTGKKIRFFLGGEYGEENKRPHYHVILFGVGEADQKIIDRSWGLGFVHVGTVSYDSACYVAGYTLKKLSGPAASEYSRRGIRPEFGLMSRRPGIGEAYVSNPANCDFVRNNGYVMVKGKKAPIPRYYADRIFKTDEEKKQLHEKRQQVIDEGFRQSSALYCSSANRALPLGTTESFRAADYQRETGSQKEKDLLKRQDIKKRRL